MLSLLKKVFSDDRNAVYFFKQLNLYAVVSGESIAFFTTTDSQISKYFALTQERKQKIYHKLRGFLQPPIVEEPEEPEGEQGSQPSPVSKILDLGGVQIEVICHEGFDINSLNASPNGSLIQVDKNHVTEWVISMTPVHKLFMLVEMFTAYSKEPTYVPIEHFAEKWFSTNNHVSSINLRNVRAANEAAQSHSQIPTDPTASLVAKALTTEYINFILRYMEKFNADPSNNVEIVDLAYSFFKEAEIIEYESESDEEDDPDKAKEEEEYIYLKVKKRDYQRLADVLK